MSERSRLSQTPGVFVDRLYVAPAAAGAGNTAPVWRNAHGARVQVQGVNFVPEGAATGHDTNTMTLTVINKGAAGAGSATVASLAFTAGVNLAAFVAKALTLGAAADLYIAAGDVLNLAKTEGGTGLALPEGFIEISYKFV